MASSKARRVASGVRTKADSFGTKRFALWSSRRRAQLAVALSVVVLPFAIAVTSSGAAGSRGDAPSPSIVFGPPAVGSNNSYTDSVTYPTPYVVPAVSDGNSSATFTFTASGSSHCSINANGTGFKYTSPGICTITTTAYNPPSGRDDTEQGCDGDSDSDDQGCTGTLVVTVNKGDQTIALGDQSTTVGSTITLAATGTSGTGAVSYALDGGTASGCSITGTALTVTGAGTCLVTATIAADSTYNTATSTPATMTFTAVVAPPPPPPPPPPPVVKPVDLTVTASSGSVTAGKSLSPTASLSGVSSSDSGSITSVTFIYQGIGVTSYGPSSAFPSSPGVYSITPTGVVVAISPSSDQSKYSSTITAVAGTLTVKPAPVVIVNKHPKLPPTRVVPLDPFSEGSFNLTNVILGKISTLASLIKNQHYTTVSLTSYTDNVFSPAFNLMLNQRRAAAVMNQLRSDLSKIGITKVTISIKTDVAIITFASNTTAKGRAANRRVVATISAS